MEKVTRVLQFGEGNFLRTFVDVYFDFLNKEGLGNFKVNIVQPIQFGSLDRFKIQNNKYHIVLQGYIDGKSVEDCYHIDSLEDVFSPFEEIEKFNALACDPSLKIIVSNTTEAGIKFNIDDKFDGFENITYPAKLTKFLYMRFKAKLPGVYLLPVELIENNADELSKCVNCYIDLWNLGDDFKKWNNKENYYCNTLVDRVVSGYPRDTELKKHLFDLVKCEDELISIGEPFGLWAIENKGNIRNILFDGHHNIDVVLTDNIAYYKKRKVRILNGSHTNLVPMCLWLGKQNVFDCMNDKKTYSFIKETLDEEIIPFVSNNIEETKVYASSVTERFLNPFINHQLTSIALNSISKWRARCLPSFKDYYTKYGKIPPHLTKGFAYLVNQYSRIYKKDNSYYVDLPSRTIEVKDDENCLTYFMNHNLKEFMSDVSLWGEDLTRYVSFYEEVQDTLKSIK